MAVYNVKPLKPLALNQDNFIDVRDELLKRNVLEEDTILKLYQKHSNDDSLFQEVIGSKKVFLIRGNPVVSIKLWRNPNDPHNPDKMIALYSVVYKEGDNLYVSPYKFIRGKDAHGIFIYSFDDFPSTSASCSTTYVFLSIKGKNFVKALPTSWTILSESKYKTYPFLKEKDILTDKGNVIPNILDDIIEGTPGKRAKEYYFEPPKAPPSIVTFWKDRSLKPSFLKAHGIDENSIQRAALDIGPTYNRIDYKGMPILGDFLRPGEVPFSTEDLQSLDVNSYAPEPGIIKFSGLTGHLNGDKKGAITFHTESDSVRPALILYEDFMTVLAMTFIAQDQPTFSLNGVHEHKEETPSYMHLCIKEWNPEWLGRTALGQTLYIADRILGDLAWYPKESIFSIDEERAISEKLPEIAKYFIRQTKGQLKKEWPKDVKTGGLRIQSGNLSYTCDLFHLDQGTEQITVTGSDAVPRIMGWYKHEDKDSSPEMYMNDPEYGHGAYANYLTKNYNTLALLLPIYERFRQLQNLYWAAFTLKATGFEIHDGLKLQLETFMRDKIARPLSPDHRKINFSHQQIG